MPASRAFDATSAHGRPAPVRPPHRNVVLSGVENVDDELLTDLLCHIYATKSAQNG